MRYARLVLFLFLLAGLGMSCSLLPGIPPAPTPTPEVTQTPAATATSLPPSPSPSPSPLPEPAVISPQNVASLKPVGQFDLVYPRRLKWSADGRLIGAITQDGLALRDARTLSAVSTVVLDPGIILFDYSPDTQLMAATTNQETLDLRRISDGQIERTIDPGEQFLSAIFAPDGRSVALASAMRIEISLWDVASGEKIAALSGFETAAPVYGASFSGDGRFLIWLARAGVQVMEIASAQFGAPLHHEDFVGGLALSPDASLLAAATAGALEGQFAPFIQLWQPESGEPLHKLTGGSSVAMNVVFSPDGRLLANESGAVIDFWDLSSYERVTELAHHTDMVSSLAFSPDGRTLAVASNDGSVTLWQVDTQP